PDAIVSDRRRGSATIAKRMVDPSSPSAGSGWTQIDCGAASWSARMEIRPARDRSTVAASAVARAYRLRLPGDGGKVTAATASSKAWFVWTLAAKTASRVPVVSTTLAASAGNASWYE